jgi:hypothetical protein
MTPLEEIEKRLARLEEWQRLLRDVVGFCRKFLGWPRLVRKAGFASCR